MTADSRPAKKAPVVFISYSHESDGHSERVLRFANRLRTEAGCESRLDRYVEASVANWPRWMRQQIREADYVLMIFTRKYRRRFDGEEDDNHGRGVVWEGTIIENSLYAAAAGSATLKFVPAAFSDRDAVQVPTDVFSGTIFIVPRDWDRLLSRLRRRASVEAPSVRRSATALRAATGFAKDSSASRTPPRSAPPKFASGILSVLFVGAQRGTNLNLRSQLSRTKEAIRRARFGRSVEMTGVFNVTPDEMLVELHRLSPQVLHLSGRQDRGLIRMHDQSGQLAAVSADQLATLLCQYQHMLRLIILDTCWSLAQAKMIVQTVDCAIGVAAKITEPVAIDFFAMFYNALATGASVGRAFGLAFGLELAKIKGDRKYRRVVEWSVGSKFDAKEHLPQLVGRKGLDLDKLILVAGG